MRVVPISKFFQMAGVDLRDETEAIQITTNRRVVGYFVPPEAWGILSAFVYLDWDGIISNQGGTPAPPGEFYNWAEFMTAAHAALGEE